MAGLLLVQLIGQTGCFWPLDRFLEVPFRIHDGEDLVLIKLTASSRTTTAIANRL